MIGETSVYIIGALDGPKKIGIARAPTHRVCHIRHVSPFPVDLLSSSSGMSRAAAYAVEQIAHAILDPCRLNGEWFDVSFQEALGAVHHAEDLIDWMGSDYTEPRDEGMTDLWLHIQRRLFDGLPWSPQSCVHASERRERTIAGLKSARARGRIGGRRSIYTDEQVLEAGKLGTPRGMKKLGMKSKAGFLRRLKQAQEAQEKQQREQA